MSRRSDGTAEFGVLADAGPKRSWFVAIGAAIAIATLVAHRKIAGWDLWWHLAIGREAVANQSAPRVDGFSYTVAGTPYGHADVAADSVLFLAFDAFGFLGLAILKGIAVIVAVWGIRRAGQRRARPAIWLLVAGGFVVAVQDRIILRPLLFSIAAFPLMLGLLERARVKLEEHGNRPQWEVQFVALLPAIALYWVWINIHRAGVLGLVLLAGHFCALLLAAGLTRVRFFQAVAGPRPTFATVGVSLAAVLIAGTLGLLNPSGVAVYTSTLGVAQSSAIREHISEWAPMTQEMALEVYPVATVMVALAALLLLVRLLSLLGRRAEVGSLSVWHLGVFAVFAMQTVGSVRWLPYLVAVAAVILLRGIDEALDDADAPLVHPRVARTFDIVVAGIVIFGLLHFSAHERGLGSADNRYPQAALDRARELELGPRVHNTFIYGGYVIWDGDFAVAIDGRNDMVYSGEVFVRASASQHDLNVFAELYHEHPADWVLADNTAGRENFQFLAGHPDWMTVHWSEEAVIYVLRPGNDHLREHELRVLDPRNPVMALHNALEGAGSDEDDLREIRRELLTAHEDSPRSLRVNFLLAMFYQHTGQRELMMRSVHTMEDIAPDHPSTNAARELVSQSLP